MQVTMILEFLASYCHLARGVAQVYLLYFCFGLCVVICFCLLHLYIFKNTWFLFKANTSFRFSTTFQLVGLHSYVHIMFCSGHVPLKLL